MSNITLNNPISSFNRGTVFILITVISWAILPLGLQVLLGKMDSITITWSRFVVAGIIAFFVQYKTGALKEFGGLNRKDWLILISACLFLIIDYVLFVYALEFISASAAQVFTQATPFFLGLGGVIFFKERINLIQGGFVLLLVGGMGLFFYDNITEAVHGDGAILIGASIVIFAALLWSIYALLQKKLNEKIRSTNVLFFTYVIAIPVLLPLSDLQSFEGLNQNDWLILLLCALNTVIAYGAFASAMKYLTVVQLSTALATTPIFTIFASYLAWILWPKVIILDPISYSGWVGVIFVVGSVIGFNYYQKR